jgi:predicted RNA methylase
MVTRSRQFRTSAKSRAAPEAKPLWLFLTEPGLAALLLQELRFIGAIERKAQAAKLHLRNHDLLVLPDVVVRRHDAAPRLATNVLVSPVFGRHLIGARQLDLLAHALLSKHTDGIATSIAGDMFARKDFLPWLLRELGFRGVRLSQSQKREAWFLAVDEKFYFGFPRFNHHDAPGRSRASEREGSLPPVVAAAMVFAAKPASNDVIFDPVMGTGTILWEAAQMARGTQLIGSDVDPSAVALARKSLAHVKGARVFHQDSTRWTPEVPNITLTLANLPFGKQHKSASGNRALYEAVLRRSLDRAATTWRAVLLTSDEESLRLAVESVGRLELSRVADIKVRGQGATIWSLRRS